MAKKFSNIFEGFFESEKVAGLLLLFCTIASITIANSPFGEGYAHFMHHHLNLSFANVDLDLSIDHWANDGLMTIFFVMVGLEVEREMYAGELSDIKKAMLPIAAAVGGMVVPSLIHYMLNKGTAAVAGFAIPMATDIAFALGILSLAGNRIPTSVKVFLAALAIIDDIGAIVVIALFYTKTILAAYLLYGFGVFAILMLLNRLKFRNLLFYILPGIVMWYFFLKSGVHPTLAGVLLAISIPFSGDDDDNISYKVQNWLHKPVAFIVVPIFAIVNTAIVLPPDLLGSIIGYNSAGIILGLFVGKVVGIVAFPSFLVKIGLAKFQPGLTRRNLVGLGLLGGIGFTMSMFIANLAFNDTELVTTSKLCILIGSALSAVTGLLVLTSKAKKRRASVHNSVREKE